MLGKAEISEFPHHFNRLTPAEDERLALLLEEMGEAQQAIGKIMRHGYESRHPAGIRTNREMLERELGDVIAAIRMMQEACDISSGRIEAHALNKRESVRDYLHHQPIRD